MAEDKTCPKCGDRLPVDAPAGICPKCLLQAGLVQSLPVVTNACEAPTVIGDVAIPADAPTLPPTEPSPAPPPSSSVVGANVRYFGDYELLCEIARGGMGVVFQARQINLNRVVALKMILAGQLAGPEDVKRFYTEAEAAAQLDHPGIVPIFEVGQHGGQHYFSMGFVEGRSLAARVAEGPLPPREAAQLVQEIAQAVQYAHEKGVIHRDLKPGNILLDKDGKPRVTDFGLAKLTESASDLTGTGQILGTPSYMPPEQASGKTDEVGPAADVYSLGAILYCLLTGRPPFQAASAMNTLLQVLDQEPVSVRQLNSQVPRDLETICLKCLEKSPGKRYDSAQDLAGDLRCFVDGEPISARPVTRGERAWKWSRKRPAAAALLVLTPLALLTAVGLIVSQSYTAKLTETNKNLETARKDADWARSEAVDLKDQTARALVKVEIFRAYSLTTLANRTLRDGDLTETHDLLQQVPEGLHNWEWRFLDQSANLSREWNAKYKALVSCVAFSKDGKRFAAGSWDNTIRIRDQEPFSVRDSILAGHTGPVTAVTFSPVGDYLASASLDGTIRIWDVKTKGATFNGGTARNATELFTLQALGSNADCLAFSPDGRLLACGEKEAQAVTIWNPSTGQRVEVLENKPGGVAAVAFSRDGQRLALATGTLVEMWDTGAWQLVRQFEQHESSVNCLIFHPDGKRLFSASESKRGGHSEYRTWDYDTGAEFSNPVRLPGPCRRAALSADGQRLALGGTDGNVWLRDFETLALQGKFRAHATPVDGLAFHPDGRLATSSGDKTNRGEIGIWRLRFRNAVRRIARFPGAVDTIAFGLDSDRIGGASAATPERLAGAGRVDASTSSENPASSDNVSLWDVATGRKLTAVPGCNATQKHPTAFSPNLMTLASCGNTGEVYLWSLATQERIAAWPIPANSSLTALAFSPDSSRLGIVFRGEVQIHLRDIASGRETGIVTTPGQEHSAFAFSPDGNRLATAGSTTDGTPVARVYHIDTSQLELDLQAVAGGISRIVWSADGKYIAAGGAEAKLQIWNARTGRPVPLVKTDSGVTRGVAFSPDSQRLAAGGLDGRIRLWDPENGLDVLELPGVDSAIASVAWSPDGQKIAAGTDDGAIFVWEISGREAPAFRILDPAF